MFRNQQRAHAVRPLALIGAQAGKQRFPRLLHNTMLRRDAVLTVDHDAQRLAQILLGIQRLGIGAQLLPAHGQRRIVRQHGGAAGQNGMALCAQTLHVASRLRGGDPLAFAAGHRRAAVQRSTQLELHPGKTGAHPLQEALVQRFRLVHHQPVADFNTGLLQTVQAAPRHLRVRILHRGDHAADAGGNQRIAARRRTAVVAAGLKGDIGGGASRLFPRYPQGVHFGVRLAGAIVEPFADDLAVFYNDTANVRVRMGGKATAGGELKRTRHVHFVLHGLVL